MDATDIKKIISLWLVFILLILFPVPAFASMQNYRTYLVETYGLSEVYVQPGAEPLAMQAMQNFDTACKIIGVEASRQIIQRWKEVRGGFRLVIALPEGPFYALFDDLGAIYMYVNPGAPQYGRLPTGFVCTVKSAVHEMMHAMDYGLLGECKAIASAQGSWEIGRINGEYEGYTDANQYASDHAADSAFEDFADTAAIMIMSGGETPCTLDKSTILYQKYDAIYNRLRKAFGPEAPMVQRCAQFLGK